MLALHNTLAPVPFWLVLGSLALAIAVFYAVLWYATRQRISSNRASRYRIAVFGLFAWAALCFARAATL